MTLPLPGQTFPSHLHNSGRSGSSSDRPIGIPRPDSSITGNDRFQTIRAIDFRSRLDTIVARSMSLSLQATNLLHEWVQSDSLRRHCYAVSDSLRHFAALEGADADLWEAVGLLHDMDYERHPNNEQSPTEGHPFVGVAWLRENGWSGEVCRAILSHADYANVPRVTPLEKTLYAVDELSGFVTAVARVRPSKSVRDVDVASVKKKMKDKGFARAVNRDDIIRGAAELGLPLEIMIERVIEALRADAPRLGLAGETP